MEAQVARRATGRAWVVPTSAVLFAVLFVVGLITVGGAPDTENKTAAEIMKTFRDEKGGAVLSAYFLVLAGMFFLPVAWAMVRRVAAGLTELAESLARTAAVLFVGLLFVASTVFASLAGAVVFGGMDDPPVLLVRYIPQIGFGLLLIAGALSAGLFLMIVGRAGQVSGAIPGWFVALTFVAAVAMLGGVAFIPMALLPMWALGAGVVLRRG
jgi:hypothetical protein